MIAKEAKKGQQVKTQYGVVIGIALENIGKGDMVIFDKEISFPTIIGSFLKILPGIKISKTKGEYDAYI